MRKPRVGPPQQRRARTSSKSPRGRNAWEAVYDLIRSVPRGRVATYGQIAQLSGRLSARAVGWALHVCPDDVPWQRIVNAAGGCSTERLHSARPGLQRALLEAEGVRFRRDGSIDLDTYRWEPEQ